MLFDLSGFNPAYTDGSKGRHPIYPAIIMRCKAINQAWVIPSAWFHSDRHKVFRQWLFDNGLYKIKINPNSTFVDATVITCVIYLRKHYKGKIDVQTVCGKTYSYDYRKYGEIVVTDSFELTDRILKNKPTNPYKFKNENIRLKDHTISDEMVEGWSKIVIKITKDDVYYGWIDLPSKPTDIRLLTSDSQGRESHSIVASYLPTYEAGNNQIVPHLATDEHLTWWRLTRFAIVESDVHVCNKYRSMICKSFEEAQKIRDYLRSDYVTEIFKYTRSSRTLDNSQFKFIPRIEDVSK